MMWSLEGGMRLMSRVERNLVMEAMNVLFRGALWLSTELLLYRCEEAEAFAEDVC